MYEYEYKVNIPEGELDGIRVERFTVNDFSSGMSFIKNPGRGVPAGEYTRLIEGKQHIWMSDTPAEWPLWGRASGGRAHPMGARTTGERRGQVSGTISYEQAR